MVEAVHELHTIVQAGHLDIKPENFVIGEDQNLILIDFGFSLLLSKSAHQKPGCGTYSYMAPEVHKSSYLYDIIKADIFSLGVCMFSVTALSNYFPRKKSSDYSKKVIELIETGFIKEKLLEA